MQLFFVNKFFVRWKVIFHQKFQAKKRSPRIAVLTDIEEAMELVLLDIQSSGGTATKERIERNILNDLTIKQDLIHLIPASLEYLLRNNFIAEHCVRMRPTDDPFMAYNLTFEGFNLIADTFWTPYFRRPFAWVRMKRKIKIASIVINALALLAIGFFQIKGMSESSEPSVVNQYFYYELPKVGQKVPSGEGYPSSDEYFLNLMMYNPHP